MKWSNCVTLYIVLISEFYFVGSDLIEEVENAVKAIHKGVDDVVKGTFDGITEVTGSPVEPKDVTFFLHTSKDITYLNHSIDKYNPVDISKTQGKIYFLVHGWTQSRNNTPWYKPFTEYMLKVEPEAHIVQVDWGKPANESYPLAAFTTESVGQIIANVIQKVVKEQGTPIERIILIGHSLGGQVVGWIGKTYKLNNNVTLPRIIALDPAGILFDARPNSRRLNKHDAEVVMVMHTNGGVFGYLEPAGTIDFFPNGGSIQPGCLKVNLSDISTLTDPIWCSHRRAYQLFVEVVKRPNSFIARKCDSYDSYKENKCNNNTAVPLGDIQTTQTGLFYLETSGVPPFIKSQEKEKKK